MQIKVVRKSSRNGPKCRDGRLSEAEETSLLDSSGPKTKLAGSKQKLNNVELNKLEQDITKDPTKTEQKTRATVK